MLLLILGAGGVLVGLAWSLLYGPAMANVKPAMVGLLLCGVGLALPIAELGNGDGPDMPGPPPGSHADGGLPGPPPGPHADGGLPGPPPGSPHGSSPPGFPIGINGMHPGGKQAQELSLGTAPSVVTRVRFACKTNAQGLGACWGEPVPVPEAPITKIALGREHGCALLSTGAISCWGEAQLEASRLSAHRFVDLAATLETICGITAQGALHCFGADLGMPEPGHRFTAISGGAEHFCALSEDGQPLCWGANAEGQSHPPEGLVLSQVSAGHFHSCGIDTEGQARCWGRNAEGQSHPPEHLRFRTTSSGWAHSCGLDAAGQAHCWGCEGRHSDLSVGDACSPPTSQLTAISAGDLWRSCALDTQGEAVCWGGIPRIGGPS
jgi:alpha-tubulin suppressor-like RCC1 family protein